MVLSIVSKPLLASLHIVVIISKWSCEEHIKTPSTGGTQTGEEQVRQGKREEKKGRRARQRKQETTNIEEQ